MATPEARQIGPELTVPARLQIGHGTNVRMGHFSNITRCPIRVRYWMNSGQHLFALSFSGFDPSADFAIWLNCPWGYQALQRFQRQNYTLLTYMEVISPEGNKCSRLVQRYDPAQTTPTL